MMKTICDVQTPDLLSAVQSALPKMSSIVQTHSERVAALARALAPKKAGYLRTGIVPSPWEERSRYPYKIGRQVYMDHRMNSTFVKHRKDGVQYYYPASQEHGFRVRRRKGTMRKVPGKYFMRSARNAESAAFFADIEEFVQEVISD